jgi:hypothetical protein
MILLNSSRLKVIIVLVKHCTIAFEHWLHCIKHGHIVLLSQGIHSMLEGKYVLFVKVKLRLIKHSVASILCVPMNVKHKFHLSKEIHFYKVRHQTENVIVFILPTIVIHRDREPLPWVALH